MNSKVSTSVILLTKNRQKFLFNCLFSLLNQTLMPDEIIIINNGSSDKTQKVIKLFSKVLPITSYYSEAKGFPRLYNLAISKTTKNLVLSINDDCVASENWLEVLVNFHKVYPRAVLQGFSKSLPLSNIYAQIMGDHYQNWLEANKLKPGFLKVVDNKNIAFPKNLLKDNFIFNEKLRFGAEDIAFGRKLVNLEIPIYLVNSAVVYHYERSTFNEFIRQHLRIARGERKVDEVLGEKEKVGGVFNYKTLLNIKSFLKREWFYLKQLKLLEFFYTPFLYFTLMIIRIYGYFFNQS